MVDYDQYAEQLLKSVFENAKQNQPSSNSNWHLLEQLEEQKKLILELKDLQLNLNHKIPTDQHSSFESSRVDIPPPISLLSERPSVSPPSPPQPITSHTPVKTKRKGRENKPPKKKPVQERPATQKTSTFWKPREERPKGWWKGNRTSIVDQEGTEPQPKKVIVRKAIPPKKVPSLQGTKAKRPLAFKTPTVKKKKNTHVEKQPIEQQDKLSMPMYVMPQQQSMLQPIMPQPFMINPQPYMIPVMNNEYHHTHTEQERIHATKRKTSVLNPRQSSNNNKCLIM